MMDKIDRTCVLLIAAINLFGVPSVHAQQLKIWYDKPAGAWTEALPVGNGSLGAMVFGKAHSERIQLNEESVWTGHPIERGNPSAQAYLDSVRQLIFDEKYVEAEKLAQQKIMGKRLDTGAHSYQTLGNLYLNFADSATVQGYRRELDLNTSLAAVGYQKDGVAYRREIFSSHPDQVLAIRLSADRPGRLTFDLKVSRPGPNEKVTVHENTIVMREHVGDGDGVRYTARLKLDQTGGSVNRTDSTLQVSKADYHININLQMNYWPAEVTNLSELTHPLFDFTGQLARRGRKVARTMYGSRGMVAHHTTDAWHFAEFI